MESHDVKSLQAGGKTKSRVISVDLVDPAAVYESKIQERVKKIILEELVDPAEVHSKLPMQYVASPKTYVLGGGQGQTQKNSNIQTFDFSQNSFDNEYLVTNALKARTNAVPLVNRPALHKQSFSRHIITDVSNNEEISSLFSVSSRQQTIDMSQSKSSSSPSSIPHVTLGITLEKQQQNNFTLSNEKKSTILGGSLFLSDANTDFRPPTDGFLSFTGKKQLNQKQTLAAREFGENISSNNNNSNNNNISNNNNNNMIASVNAIMPTNSLSDDYQDEVRDAISTLPPPTASTVARRGQLRAGIAALGALNKISTPTTSISNGNNSNNNNINYSVSAIKSTAAPTTNNSPSKPTDFARGNLLSATSSPTDMEELIKSDDIHSNNINDYNKNSSNGNGSRNASPMDLHVGAHSNFGRRSIVESTSTSTSNNTPRGNTRGLNTRGSVDDVTTSSNVPLGEGNSNNNSQLSLALVHKYFTPNEPVKKKVLKVETVDLYQKPIKKKISFQEVSAPRVSYRTSA